LIEAGPGAGDKITGMPLGIGFTVPRKNKYNYAYETVPQAGFNGRRGYQPRGRGVGGSSLINAMICIRGQREDYNAWAAAGCTGWAWDDVAPVFKQIENVEGGAEGRGTYGPLHVSSLRQHNKPIRNVFIEAATSLGFPLNPDFNGVSQEGVGPYQVFQHQGKRHDAGKAYLTAPPENLHVIANTTVNKVLIEARRAVGVSTSAGVIKARKEVVLSGGAFGSPQLLMLSGIGPAGQLKAFDIDVIADRTEVGQNLQDHVDFTTSIVAKIPGALSMSSSTIIKMATQTLPYTLFGKGPMTSNSAEAGGFIKSSATVDRPDLQFHYCVGIVDDHGRKMHMKAGVSLHVCPLRPYSRGTVSLQSTDIQDAPSIDPNFLFDPRDLDLLIKGARLSEQILSAPAFATYHPTPLHNEFGLDDQSLEHAIRSRTWCRALTGCGCVDYAKFNQRKHPGAILYDWCKGGGYDRGRGVDKPVFVQPTLHWGAFLSPA